jgi:hypothetical protein
MSRAGILAAALLLATLGCAAAETEPELATPQAGVTGGAAQTELPAAGYGRLRQDDFTVSFRSGPLLLKVTPLTEAVIRMAAPDTYERLHALAESRREDAVRASGLGQPELMLVSLFSYERDATFEPSDLQIVQRGRLLRPVAILPLTPGWGGARLGQQETQLGLYAFEPDVDFRQVFTVRYGMEQSDAWARVIPRLEQERQRVQARTGGSN